MKTYHTIFEIKQILYMKGEDGSANAYQLHDYNVKLSAL